MGVDWDQHTNAIFQEKSKNFYRSLSILLGVTTFFFFFILLPYFSILDKTAETIKQLDFTKNLNNDSLNFKTNVLRLNDTLFNDNETMVQFYENIHDNLINNAKNCNDSKYILRLIQTTDEEIDEVKSNVDNKAFWRLDVCYALAENKGKILNPNNSTILSFYNTSFPTDSYNAYSNFVPDSYKFQYKSPILNKKEIELLEYFNSSYYVNSPFWFSGNLQNKLNAIFNNHIQEIKLLQSNISEIGNKINSSSQLYNDSSSVNVDKIIQNLRLLNDSLPTLMNYYVKVFNNASGGKGFNFKDDTPILSPGDLKNLLIVVTGEIKKNNPIFIEIRQNIELQIKNFNNTLARLNTDITKLDVKKNETTSMLKEIEFPFGKIPVSINDAISFFPIGIGIGFLITAYLLGGAILLRERLDIKINTKYKMDEDEKKKLSVLAPLWIEPYSHPLVIIIKFLPLIVPLVYFVISLNYLSIQSDVFYSEETLSGVFVGNSQYNEGLYVLSNYFGSFLLLCGYAIIIWRVVTYERK